MNFGKVTARKWKDNIKNGEDNPVGFHVTFWLGFLENKTREEEAASRWRGSSSQF